RKPLSPDLLASPSSVAAVAAPSPLCTACGDSPKRPVSACFISGVTIARIESMIELAIVFSFVPRVVFRLIGRGGERSAFLLLPGASRYPKLGLRGARSRAVHEAVRCTTG